MENVMAALTDMAFNFGLLIVFIGAAVAGISVLYWDPIEQYVFFFHKRFEALLERRGFGKAEGPQIEGPIEAQEHMAEAQTMNALALKGLTQALIAICFITLMFCGYYAYQVLKVLNNLVLVLNAKL